MKKRFCLCCLLLLCIFLTGCGSNQETKSDAPAVTGTNADSASGTDADTAADTAADMVAEDIGALFNRPHDAKDDLIKFHNLDWLILPADVKKELAAAHGEDSFIMTKAVGGVYTAYNDNVFSFQSAVEKTADHSPLQWEVGGFPLKKIFVYFTNHPDVSIANTTEDNIYLYSGAYIFLNPDSDMAHSLIKRLDKYYGESERGGWEYADIDLVWTDANDNLIELTYWSSSEPLLKLTYTCGDILNRLQKAYDENNEEKLKQEIEDDLL